MISSSTSRVGTAASNDGALNDGREMSVSGSSVFVSILGNVGVVTVTSPSISVSQFTGDTFPSMLSSGDFALISGKDDLGFSTRISTFGIMAASFMSFSSDGWGDTFSWVNKSLSSSLSVFLSDPNLGNLNDGKDTSDSGFSIWMSKRGDGKSESGFDSFLSRVGEMSSCAHVSSSIVGNDTCRSTATFGAGA